MHLHSLGTFHLGENGVVVPSGEGVVLFKEVLSNGKGHNKGVELLLFLLDGFVVDICVVIFLRSCV